MVTVHVLNQNFVLQGIIDNYESLIWRCSYSDVGDFELYLSATPKSVDLLQKNRYLVRDKDISVSDSGVVTYKKVMIIKNIDITTNIEDGDYIKVTGRELKFILHSRIVWKMTTLNSTTEAGIRKLITDNAISPTDSKRVIPTLALDDAVGLTDTLDKQVTGENLDTVITEICQTYNYGWEIYISDNALRFNLYQGVNRSYEQTDRPYVLFSDDFDNLFNTDYQLESEEYANTTLVGGEGEGKNRKYYTVNGGNSGLDRFEVFTDARDVSSEEDDVTLTTSEYNKLLLERGKESLAELGITEGFSGELKTTGSFEYGVDFFLGDTVTVINKYGISRNVMVLSAIESYDENGESLIPEFNI